MAQNYIRQSTLYDGETITASLFNNEYNQIVNAFSYSSTDANSTGHTHDGSLGQGGNIPKIGDLDFKNKIVVDSTNNRWGVYVEVSGAAVEQVRIQDGAVVPVTTNDIDLGTSVLEFKDLFLDGTAHVDTLDVDVNASVAGTLTVGGDLTVTGNATISGNLTFGDADTDSINLAAEIDSNIIPNTDGTYNLGSATKEWQDLYIDGTANIDSLVADTADINGGTIDGTVIGGTTAAAGSFTSVSLPDNGKAIFGDGSDLQIYHSGTHSFIEDKGDGNLYIDGASSVVIRGETANTISAIFNDAGSVVLKHSGDTKLSTASTGIDVTGTVTADGLTVSTATGSASPTATEATISSSTSASDWSTTSAWGVLGFYSADTSGGGAGNRAQISTNMEVATGAYSSLDFTLANPSNAYAQDSWLKLQNSASSASRKVIVSADGGLDVTGTVEADGLTVDGTSQLQTVSIYDNGTNATVVADAGHDLELRGRSGQAVNVFSNGSTTAVFGSNGDISFYNDAAAQGLFWDSSASMLGIGTTIPGQKLEIKESSIGAGDAIIRLRGHGNNAENTPLGSLEWFNTDSSGPQPGVVAAVEAQSANANGHMGKLLFKTHDGSGSEADPPTTRMTIDESGNVGIGTSSPSGKLNLSSSANTVFRLDDTNGTSSYHQIETSGTNGQNLIISGDQGGTGGGGFIFRVNGASEAMRIDQSGIVLVGKTGSSSAIVGFQAGQDGFVAATRANAQPLVLNRTTSDGTILDLRKDGTTVGSVSTISSDLCIGGSTTRVRFDDNGAITPRNGSDANSDATIDLGQSGGRFKDLYLSGTATMGGLTVSSDSGGPVYLQDSNATATYNISELSNNAGNFNVQTRDSSGVFVSTDYQIIKNASGADYHRWFTQGTERLRIDASGNVGIGTSSPTQPLNVVVPDNSGVQIESAAGHKAYLFFGDDAANTVGRIGYDHATDAMGLWTDSQERVVIDSSGNVGIGTASPVTDLDVRNNISMGDGTSVTNLSMTRNSANYISASDAAGYLVFRTGGSVERVRIDASGNLLVGTTSIITTTDTSGSGHDLRATGAVLHKRDGGTVQYLNRLTSDGEIVNFSKDGTTVGNIGTINGDMYLGTGDTGLFFSDGSNYIMPYNVSTPGLADGLLDLGRDTNRFKDLHLSGTATMGGLTVSASAATANITSTSGGATLKLTHPTAIDGYSIRQGNANADDFRIFEGSKIKLNITTGGDISFYEDTGTTAKLFWDASAESLGIGNTDPSAYGAFRVTQTSADSGGGIAVETGTVSARLYVDGSGIRHLTAGTTDVINWDASGNVGIGGTPDTALTVFGGGVAQFRVGNIGPSNNSAIRVSRHDTSVTSGNPLGYLEFGGKDSTSNLDTSFAYVGAEASGAHAAGDNPTDLVFGTTADNTAVPTERMRIDASGNVGIGTSSPQALIDLKDTTPTLRLTDGRNITWSGNETLGNIEFFSSDVSAAGAHVTGFIKNINDRSGGSVQVAGALTFGVADYDTAASEAMRIDSSGNLLVGKTSTGAATAGIELNGANDLLRIARDGGVLQELNLIGGTGGDIIEFRKDNSAVGSIGVDSSDNMYITSSATNHVGLYLGGGGVLPMNSGSLDTGDNVDIGSPNYQFVDLHLSNSVALTNDTSVTVPAINFTDTDTSPGVTQTTGEINWTDSHSAYGNTGVKMYGQYTVSGMHSFVLRTNDATTPANLETRLVVNSNGFQIYDGAGSEAARFDGSGNLLVNKTSSALATAGIELRADNTAYFTKDSSTPVLVNRINTDGDLIQFRQDNATPSVGSIGVSGNDLYIGTGDTTIRFADGDDAVIPRGTAGAVRDGAIDLGISNNRFKDLYLSGGAYLGGTGAANKLEDYEEGTFTPVMENVTGWSGSSGVSGTYTKIGDTVHVFIKMTSNSALTGTPTNKITGLPFTSNLGEYLSNVSISRMFGIHLTTTDYTGGVSGSDLTFLSVNGDNNVNNLTHSGSTLRFTVSATYTTSS